MAFSSGAVMSRNMLFLLMSPLQAAPFSDRIRAKALQIYIIPAREAGKTRVSIPVRELMQFLPEFAEGRQSIFCSALKARPFLRSNGLTIEGSEGPMNMRGTSVIYHYKLDYVRVHRKEGSGIPEDTGRLAEQLLGPLRGLLRKEIADYGGVEAYMRWVRSDAPTA